MQARISRQGEVVVVHLSGRVDVETAEPFRDACLNQLVELKVVFDFQNLSFVGSSGILPFLETMQEFAGRNANGFKLCGVSSEFRKVFASTPLHVIQIFENHHQAIQAFLSPAVESSPAEGTRAPGGPAPITSSQAPQGTGD